MWGGAALVVVTLAVVAYLATRPRTVEDDIRGLLAAPPRAPSTADPTFQRIREREPQEVMRAARRMLGSSSSDDRLAALTVFADSIFLSFDSSQLAGTEALVAASLDDPNAEIRVAAARALCQVWLGADEDSDESAIDALVQMLSSADEREVAMASFALAYSRGHRDRLIPELRSVARTPGSRTFALLGLERMRAFDAEAVRVAIDALDDHDWGARSLAAHLLGRTGELAIDAALPLLARLVDEDEHVSVREYASEALAAIPSEAELSARALRGGLAFWSERSTLSWDWVHDLGKLGARAPRSGATDEFLAHLKKIEDDPEYSLAASCARARIALARDSNADVTGCVEELLSELAIEQEHAGEEWYPVTNTAAAEDAIDFANLGVSDELRRVVRTLLETTIASRSADAEWAEEQLARLR